MKFTSLANMLHFLCNILLIALISFYYSFAQFSSNSHKTNSLHIFSRNYLKSDLSPKGKNQKFFIENKGQWPDEVLYLTRINGLDAWITRKGVVYDFFQLREIKPSKQDDKPLGHNPKDEIKEFERYGHVVRVNNVDASVMCKPVGLNKKQGYYNYFIGNDPKKWASFVGLYEEVRVEGIYKGIDQRWYFDGNSLRYDYIVHPGADYRQIKLSFEGEYNVFIKDNELYFTTRFGDVKQAELLVYQEENGVKEILQSKWVERDGKISFEIEDYCPKKKLIIDPMIYSTLIGGNSEDFARIVKLDENNNICLLGYTGSSNFPTTKGVYDNTFNKLTDLFIMKFDAKTKQLKFSTFIGGNDGDDAFSLAINAQGKIFIVGSSSSEDFPITNNSFDKTFNGIWDAIVVTLSSDGSKLEYSTFIGGENFDYAYSLDLDKNGNIVISGYTESPNFPISSASFDKTHNGSADVFLTKLNPQNNKLAFSTFFGGSSWENCYTLLVDSIGNVFLFGSTLSSDFPTTTNSYDQTHNGERDVFVAKFNDSGENLLFSTFVGGSQMDDCYYATFNNLGQLCLVGATYSSDFPITNTTYDKTFNGLVDGFVVLMSPDGRSLLYSTFFGGSESDIISSVIADNEGNIFFAGYTKSADFPTTVNAFDISHNDYFDAFISALSPSLSSLTYSSFLGGNDMDYCFSLSLLKDAASNVFLSGKTSSINFPVTPNAFDNSFNGGSSDLFLSEFQIPIPNSVEKDIQHSNSSEIIVLFPNPTYENLVIMLTSSAYNCDFEVSVLSLSGEMMFQKICKSNTNENLFLNLDIPTKLSSGTYILQVSNGRELLRRQFVVVR